MRAECDAKVCACVLHSCLVCWESSTAKFTMRGYGKRTYYKAYTSDLNKGLLLLARYIDIDYWLKTDPKITARCKNKFNSCLIC